MREAEFPIGRGWKKGRDGTQEQRDGIGSGEASAGGGAGGGAGGSDEEEEEDGVARPSARPGWTVAALPNVCYSCALALFLSNTVEDRVRAKEALREALLRFPVLLKPLIEKSRNELGSRVTQLW